MKSAEFVAKLKKLVSEGQLEKTLGILIPQEPPGMNQALLKILDNMSHPEFSFSMKMHFLDADLL